jgi:hypothetical protein
MIVSCPVPPIHAPSSSRSSLKARPAHTAQHAMQTPQLPKGVRKHMGFCMMLLVCSLLRSTGWNDADTSQNPCPAKIPVAMSLSS